MSAGAARMIAAIYARKSTEQNVSDDKKSVGARPRARASTRRARAGSSMRRTSTLTTGSPAPSSSGVPGSGGWWLRSSRGRRSRCSSWRRARAWAVKGWRPVTRSSGSSSPACASSTPSTTRSSHSTPRWTKPCSPFRRWPTSWNARERSSAHTTRRGPWRAPGTWPGASASATTTCGSPARTANGGPSSTASTRNRPRWCDASLSSRPLVTASMRSRRCSTRRARRRRGRNRDGRAPGCRHRSTRCCSGSATAASPRGTRRRNESALASTAQAIGPRTSGSSCPRRTSASCRRSYGRRRTPSSRRRGRRWTCTAAAGRCRSICSPSWPGARGATAACTSGFAPAVGVGSPSTPARATSPAARACAAISIWPRWTRSTTRCSSASVRSWRWISRTRWSPACERSSRPRPTPPPTRVRRSRPSSRVSTRSSSAWRTRSRWAAKCGRSCDDSRRSRGAARCSWTHSTRRPRADPAPLSTGAGSNVTRGGCWPSDGRPWPSPGTSRTRVKSCASCSRRRCVSRRFSRRAGGVTGSTVPCHWQVFRQW